MVPVEPQHEERRLTAILSADVVGYSRLMGRDEAGTLAALKAHRRQLEAPKVNQYHGRIVKLMGDGALMVFASVVDAVRFAVEVQCAMRDSNVDVPEDRRIVYRIGINIGDIIVDGEDIYGDGVNIAARLQGLAEPGGICIARNVYNQIKGKLDLNVEPLGEKDVKNIAEPLMVYRVVLDDKAAALVTPLPEAPVKAGRVRRWYLIAALVVVVLALGGLVWWQYWSPDFEAASVQRMALPLPEKPSIAVLPFDNLSGDAEQGYFADGMTEDLITDLSKLSGIFVISRNSSWTYKGKAVKVQQVAEDLGVRYVLEGSARRQGDQLRVNAQLVDALTGRHLWAERYDGSMRDVFAFQDNVIGQIVTSLAIRLTREEAAQVAEAEASVPRAYDAVLQGWDHYRRETKDETAKAIAQFEKAIELDPGYSQAYAGLAATYWRLLGPQWAFAVGSDWDHTWTQMQTNLAKALEKPTVVAYAVSAELLARYGRYEEAVAQIDRALSLGGNPPDIYISKARILNATGRASEAEESVRLAMRLNPHYPQDYLRVLGQALFHQQRYAAAAELMERVVSRQGDEGGDYVTLAAIYGHLGRKDEAEAAVAKYNELSAQIDYNPLNLQEARFWWYTSIFDYDEAYRERLVDGLRKAGVPEGIGSDVSVVELKRRISERVGEFDVEGATKIDATKAHALHARGVVFIDVRDGGSFGRGHIPGAVNLDLTIGLSKDSLAKLVGKDDEVTFYCWGKHCAWSPLACARVLIWGYKRVYYFAGGFPAWQDAGYSIEASLK